MKNSIKTKLIDEFSVIFKNKIFLFLFLFSAIVPLFYCLYTNHIWEDFFITFRCSENLCNGDGLVYEPGVKIHAFTSPIGTLIPAFCHILTGKTSYLFAIWSFRILFCIPFFVAGCFLIIKLLDKVKTPPIMVLFAALFYIFDVKGVMFSVNGMETAFMLFFILWLLYLMKGNLNENWFYQGMAWGGLMWTRPDSCIYIAAFVFSSFIFIDNFRKEAFISYIKAGLVTTIIYLPWFAWAWIYYGTPVPHTVTAKGVYFAKMGFGDIINNTISNIWVRLPFSFGPVYPNFNEWPFLIYIFSLAGGIFCNTYWLLKFTNDKFGRFISFVYFLVFLYFCYIPYPCPWYIPPHTVLGILIIVMGTYSLCKNISNKKVPIYICSIFFAFMFALFFLSTFQMKLHQKYIEDGVRMKVGKSLRDKIDVDDRIYLECLGYIGYFSGGKMLDFPGLASPEVAKLLRNGETGSSVIAKLQPEWVVLRAYEYEGVSRQSSYFRDNYELVEIFSSQEELKQYRYIPGRSYIIGPSCFGILRKKTK
jgi:hypothetical protein